MNNYEQKLFERIANALEALAKQHARNEWFEITGDEE